MANRWFFQQRLSLERNVVDLYLKVTFGAAGAPTLSVPDSLGVKSITRNSTGNYTILLTDSYRKFLLLEGGIVNATAPAAPTRYTQAQQVGNKAAPTITVQYTNAGASTDPGNGEVAYLHIALSN